MAQTDKTVTAITGRAVEGGRTSEITRLESAEATKMPAARTDIGSGSATLDISLKCLWNTWVSSNATFTTIGNTGVASVMPIWD